LEWVVRGGNITRWTSDNKRRREGKRIYKEIKNGRDKQLMSEQTCV